MTASTTFDCNSPLYQGS